MISVVLFIIIGIGSFALTMLGGSFLFFWINKKEKDEEEIDENDENKNENNVGENIRKNLMSGVKKRKKKKSFFSWGEDSVENDDINIDNNDIESNKKKNKKKKNKKKKNKKNKNIKRSEESKLLDDEDSDDGTSVTTLEEVSDMSMLKQFEKTLDHGFSRITIREKKKNINSKIWKENGWIKWVVPGLFGRKKIKSFALFHLKEVLEGKKSDSFKDDEEFPDDLCLSLVTDEECLDIIMSCKMERDVIMRGFQLLIDETDAA